MTTQGGKYIIVNNLGGAIVPPSMFEPAFTGGGPPVNTSSLWIVKHDIEEELRMKKKKLAALLLAGAMGLGLLAGCSNGGKPENGGGDTVTIKVGGIGPTTGDNAQYGTATEWGAEIAVEEINALNGPVKLEFKYEDDTGAADTAVAAYNNLKDWAKDAPDRKSVV